MRARRGAAAAFAGLWAIAIACGPSSGTADAPAFDDAHRAAIRDSVQVFLAEYSALVESGAYDRLIGLYADVEDFVWIEDGRVAYRSRAEIEEAFAGLRSMNAEVRTTYVDPDIVALAPGLASVASGLDQEFVMESGSFGFQGAVSATLVHTPDGWRFLRGHTSTVRPDGER